ncbi:MAG: DNA-binding NtrC family response regulator [Planctomycetota bacterium]|jgi:DNA-binding NtrC family response regulator
MKPRQRSRRCSGRQMQRLSVFSTEGLAVGRVGALDRTVLVPSQNSRSGAGLNSIGMKQKMNFRILIIDDDEAILDLVEMQLLEESFEVIRAASAIEGLDRIADSRPHAVILDLHLPDRPGHELIELFTRTRPNLPIVVLTGAGSVEEATSCMSAGAFDFIEKPFDRARLLTSVRNALRSGVMESQLERASEEFRREGGLKSLLGTSPAINELKDLLIRAGNSDVTVLITGESGTGKEVAARALHAESERCRGPFVAVNCGAIPENLIESELFGHEEGAFTGAKKEREGRFEQAEGGTIFLDEIGELRIDLQVRLLRVLQERCVDRIGGKASIPIDVRVIAATNRDLNREISLQNFREDLYYRISVFPLKLPPLRDRDGDLRILVEHFLEKFASRHKCPTPGVEKKAWHALRAYEWPGNIRELMNVIERSIILEDGDLITLDSLPDLLVCRAKEEFKVDEADDEIEDVAHVSFVSSAFANNCRSNEPYVGTEEFLEPQDEIRSFDYEEARIVLRALDRFDWNVRLVAAKLGLARATVYRKIEKHGLKRTPERL